MPPTPWRRARACAIRRSSTWWRAKRPTALPIWCAMARPSTATATARWRWAAKPPIPRPHRACQGDRAGAEISRTLADARAATPSITMLEGFHAVELAMEDGRVTGLFARYGIGRDARLVLFRAPRRDLRHRRPGRALCRHHQSPGSARRRSGHGGARRRPDRRSRIRPVPSHRHRHRPRSRAAGDRSAARRRRDADQ